jgi:hypothetical protein
VVPELVTFCETVLAQDKRIGSAMLVGPQGDIIEWKTQGPLLMPKEEIASLAGIWTVIVEGVAKQTEKYFGKSEVNSLTYEKLVIHGLPFGDKTLVITARKDLPLETVLNLKKIVLG